MTERVLPHNIDAEQSVLGSMFISKYAAQKCVENLSNDLFYLEAHDKIFTVVVKIDIIVIFRNKLELFLP